MPDHPEPMPGPTRRALLAAGAGAALLPGRARAADLPVLRLGVLTDLSGQYRDNSGPTSVEAARLAVADFAPERHGFAVEVLSADHGQKPDVGASIVRQWFDRGGVDAVADLNNTAVALAADTVARERDKALLISGGASTELTGRFCSPNHVHWTPDSYGPPHAVGETLVDGGHKRWFLVVADYTFGHSLENVVTTLLRERGGTVVGSAAYPFPGTTDFSSFLLRAQSSGADVLGLCCTGGDMENCAKQSREFGLNRSGMITVPTLGFVTEVHALGLEVAQGMLIAQTFYWDMNERTRGFTARLLARAPGNYPSSLHAGCYSAVTHYLRTAAAMGVAQCKASGRAAIAAMKATPTEDDCFGRQSVRADGRFLTPIFLFRCKAPAESHGPWDLFTPLSTIPADRAWRPLDPACTMLKA